MEGVTASKIHPKITGINDRSLFITHFETPTSFLLYEVFKANMNGSVRRIIIVNEFTFVTI